MTRRLRSVVFGVCSGIALTLAAVLFLRWYEVMDRFFFDYDAIVYDPSPEHSLEREEVWFSSLDGTKLNAWFVPAASQSSGLGAAKGTVVFMHGNDKNLTAHWSAVSWLPAEGYNVFVFDYRGFGKSDGRPSFNGVYQDAVAALRYVHSRKDVDTSKLIVLGQSLGGAIAIEVLGSGSKEGVKAVVLDSAFSSYVRVANDNYPLAGSLLSAEHDPMRYVKGISPVPVLFIHGTNDHVVPYSHATELLEAAGDPKALITIGDGGHTDAFTGRYQGKYKREILAFISRYL